MDSPQCITLHEHKECGVIIEGGNSWSLMCFNTCSSAEKLEFSRTCYWSAHSVQVLEISGRSGKSSVMVLEAKMHAARLRRKCFSLEKDWHNTEYAGVSVILLTSAMNLIPWCVLAGPDSSELQYEIILLDQSVLRVGRCGHKGGTHALRPPFPTNSTVGYVPRTRTVWYAILEYTLVARYSEY